MRKLLLTTATALFSATVIGQNIYTEDFDACTLPVGWENVAVTGPNTWIIGADAPDGGSVDGTCFAYIDDDALGSGAPALIADLITPVIDLSAYGNAEFRFDYIFEDIGSSFMSVSFWDGSQWDVVWTENTDPGCFGFFPTCQPRQAAIPLAGYLNADFRAKITYNDGNGWSWWAAVDNIAIYLPPAVDAELAAINAPVSGCGLGNEAVTLSIYNNGQSDITDIGAGYSLDGDVWVTENFTVNIAPGGTGTVTFATLADLSAEGSHDIHAYLQLEDDAYADNDSSVVTINNIPVFGSALPYFEDFESSDGGWVAGGTNSTWALGTPAGTFINAAYSGANSWVTNLNGQYVNNESSYIESPCFDFSSLVIDPVLRFAQIYETENCCDGGWVDISYDGGGTWTRLGVAGSGTNWYNNANLNRWNGNSGPATQWRTAMHLLDGAAGESSVKIRFFFSSDGSVVREGFGVDDIEIFEQPPINAGVVEVISPVTGCGLGDSEVTIVIENFGEADLTGFDVVYDAGNGPVTEQFTGILLSGETDTFTFATLLDLSIIGTYSITAYTDVEDDGDHANDSLTVTINSVPIFGSALPYFEDFESGDGGWVAGGNNSTWALGPPAGTFINAAYSGVNSWVTNLNGQYVNNESSYIESPCFDFSSLELDPVLSFAQIYETENCCDGGWVDISYDGGGTWIRLGVAGSGTNWYNNANLNRWNGNSGPATQWRTAIHLLDGAAGESSVKIRFFFSSDGSVVREGFGVDDVSITEQATTNGEMTAISSPVSGCGLSAAETVTVTVSNTGITDIEPVSVSYQVNGGAIITQVWDTLLAPMESIGLTFDDAADLATAGDYIITAWVNVPDDSDASNDTLSITVQSVPVVSDIPYFIDFEDGTGGWSSTGTNGTWQLGDPLGVFIQNAYSGVNAWATNLNTINYNNSQTSYLMSPCLDFSDMVDDPIIEFAIIHHSEPGWDGTQLEVSINGGTTWSVLGTVNSGINWYNNASNNWWDGSSNGNITWMVAEHILQGVAGQADVRVRFKFSSDGSVNTYEGVAVDDIHIYPQPQLDLAAISFDGPGDNCNLGSLPVTFTFWNKGLSAVSGFEVGFSVNGGAVQSETVNATLYNGDTLTYTFTSQLADLSAEGTHVIDVFTMLAGDEIMDNDSVMGGTVFNYGSSTPLSQEVNPNLAVSSTIPGGTSSTIYFCGIEAGLNAACFSIANVTIGSLPHTWLSDLIINLISPAGDTVLLSANNGGSGDDMVNVVFDDNSNNDITQQTFGIAPGTYAPQDPNGFSTFYNGQDPNGGWTLWIQDVFGGDDGVLENWSITFVDNSPSVAVSNQDTTLCLTHVLNVSAQPGFTSYLWSTGQNGQTIDIYGSQLGEGVHEIWYSVDQSGCSGMSDSFTITVDACVGISSPESMDILLYPNPTDGLLTLELTGNADRTIVEVIDMSGRILMTTALQAVNGHMRSTLDVGHLASGIYAVRLNGDASGAIRFVKR